MKIKNDANSNTLRDIPHVLDNLCQENLIILTIFI